MDLIYGEVLEDQGSEKGGWVDGWIIKTLDPRRCGSGDFDVELGMWRAFK